MKNTIAHYMAQPNKGDTHQILNVSMIIMLSIIYKKVIVYAPKECCEDLKIQLSQKKIQIINKIVFIPNKIYFKSPILFWISCGLQTFKTIYKAQPSDILYFSTLNPIMFPMFNLWCYLSHKDMYTLCHNDLEYLITPKFGKINLHWHLINFIFKNMQFATHNHLIVLGDSIKNNLKGIIPSKKINKNIISICHPYYSNSIHQNSKVNPSNQYFKIGIVGAIKKKDLEQIKIINKILDTYPNIKMYSISISQEDLSQYNNLINLNKKNKHLERWEYDQIITTMDALYYPYPSSSYTLSASGAVYEAIVKGIPIISIENPYFKWLFQTFGNLGFLYNDIRDLDNILKRLKNKEEIDKIKINAQKASIYINPLNYYKILESKIHNSI